MANIFGLLEKLGQGVAKGAGAFLTAKNEADAARIAGPDFRQRARQFKQQSSLRDRQLRVMDREEDVLRTAASIANPDITNPDEAIVKYLTDNQERVRKLELRARELGLEKLGLDVSGAKSEAAQEEILNPLEARTKGLQADIMGEQLNRLRQEPTPEEEQAFELKKIDRRNQGAIERVQTPRAISQVGADKVFDRAVQNTVARYGLDYTDEQFQDELERVQNQFSMIQGGGASTVSGSETTGLPTRKARDPNGNLVTLVLQDGQWVQAE